VSYNALLSFAIEPHLPLRVTTHCCCISAEDDFSSLQVCAILSKPQAYSISNLEKSLKLSCILVSTTISSKCCSRRIIAPNLKLSHPNRLGANIRSINAREETMLKPLFPVNLECKPNSFSFSGSAEYSARREFQLYSHISSASVSLCFIYLYYYFRDLMAECLVMSRA
jgi:hypothetical protein